MGPREGRGADYQSQDGGRGSAVAVCEEGEGEVRWVGDLRWRGGGVGCRGWWMMKGT